MKYTLILLAVLLFLGCAELSFKDQYASMAYELPGPRPLPSNHAEKLALGQRLFTLGCQEGCHLKEFGWTSGSADFPGGFGAGLSVDTFVTHTGRVPVVRPDLDDGLPIDIPRVKALGIAGAHTRTNFGASGRFKDSKDQIRIAMKGHGLLTDSVKTSLRKEIVKTYGVEVNDSIDELIVDAIDYFQSQEPFVTKYHTDHDDWGFMDRQLGISFIKDCAGCHSRVDGSGGYGKGLYEIPGFDPDCRGEHFDLDKRDPKYSDRATPNLVNIGSHRAFGYKGKHEDLKGFLIAHRALDKVYAEQMSYWLLSKWVTE